MGLLGIEWVFENPVFLTVDYCETGVFIAKKTG